MDEFDVAVSDLKPACNALSQETVAEHGRVIPHSDGAAQAIGCSESDRKIYPRKPTMKTRHSGMIETVKDKIVAAIKGTGNIVQATVDTVTQTLTTTIKDTAKVGTSAADAVAHVASGAIHGVAQVGADLTQAAQGIMLGVLRGTKQTGKEALDTISHTAQIAIRDTAKVGGDVGAAATGLVVGAIEGAKEIGVSAEDAAAADGAMKAAGKIGKTAVETVRKAVTKPVHGVKVVLKEPPLAKAA
ncbi:MAG: hypothetical protein MUC91_00115 [Verrucomicrobia bacterium]|nr:hypothetical protein [Verrucomicrobiota bacterium]